MSTETPSVQQNRREDDFLSFLKRHKNELMCCIPTRQEGKRHDATNGESLTTHFATLERLVKDNDIDGSCICNLEEIRGTPGKDVSGRGHCLRVMRRYGNSNIGTSDWNKAIRATLCLS